MFGGNIPDDEVIFCRICFDSEVELCPFESISGDPSRTFKDILFLMGFIKQTIPILASEHICSNCIDKLGSAFSFKMLCEKSDATLEEYFKGKCTPSDRHESPSHDAQIENFTEPLHLDDILNIDDEMKKLSHAGNSTRPANVENDYKTFICDYCSWCCSKLSILKCHIKKAHRKCNSRYICNVCGKTLTSRNGYYVHMKIHQGQKDHICAICGAKFVTSSSLTVHIRIHDKTKPFPCTYINCERTFQTKAAMNTHMRCVHTKERPFDCDICLKTFSTQSNFIMHRRTHLRVKSVNCTICNRPLSNEQSLKKHMRIHTGERPYKCHECGEKLISSSALSIHLQIKHSNIQYDCHICRKRFQLRTVLRKHLKIHFH